MYAVKKPKIACRYKADWSRYKMKPSKKGATHAFCTVCHVDISIAAGGKNDVERHLKTAKHVDGLSKGKSQPTLSTFMAQTSASKTVEDQAMAAEIYFAKFVAEHNLPFLVADHFSRLTKVMFPDSKIAEHILVLEQRRQPLLPVLFEGGGCTVVPFCAFYDTL